jgi:hypothetical protein
MSEDCGGCKFYRMSAVGNDLCRRFPNFVPRSPRDWCGEFAPGILYVAPKPKEETVEAPKAPKKGKAK